MRREKWQDLRVNDRIHFVAMPTGFDSDNCQVDTLEAYRKLIERGRAVRVYQLDELKMPWIQFRLRCPDGTWEHHSLLVNHDGWVRVKSRKSSN